MECPICKKSTKAVRSLYAGGAGKAIERRCPDGHRWTFAVQLVGQIRKRGDGPHAIATRLARGENPVPQHEHVEIKKEDAENEV